MKRRLRIATEKEIISGETTDIYFERTLKVLEKDPEVQSKEVVAEITVSSYKHDWAVFAGLEDIMNILEGKKIEVWAIPEGTVFFPRSSSGIKIPVITIVGQYTEFAKLETPLLGLLGTTTGMVTSAARIRYVAKNKTLLSFGARRAHPVLSPLVSYCAFIGGCDGVSSILGAKLLGIEPSGTMPHALIILFESHKKAWKAYDEIIDQNIPRIALCDTYLDEKVESQLAVEILGDKLWGIRLDTPGSRRGNFLQIIQEIRWELEVRNYRPKIFVSGGIGESQIVELREFVDGFGVGSAISNAPSVDFALDIVALRRNEIWVPAAKRGKFSSQKDVWQCSKCLQMEVTPFTSNNDRKCPKCGTNMNQISSKVITKGEITSHIPKPSQTQAHIIKQVKKLIHF